MTTTKIFGHTIHQIRCPSEHWYNSSNLKNSIDTILNLSEIKNRVRGHVWDSHYGEGETSEVVPYLGPANIPDAKDIANWVKQQAAQVLGVDSVIIDRSWTNRMNKGSQGRCHQHIGDAVGLATPDLVAVFYVSNTSTGSSLVIVNEDHTGELPSNIPENNKAYITPLSGDLIMHGPNVYHAVSEHNSPEPRICFVYQICVSPLD